MKQVGYDNKRAMIAVLVFLLIQLAVSAGSFSATYWSQKQALSEVSQRVSLDISTLDLGTENADSVANIDEVKRYVVNINEYLAINEFPIRVQTINTIGNNDLPTSFSHAKVQILSANNEDVILVVASESVFNAFSISYAGIVLALLYFVFPHIATQPSKTEVTKDIPDTTPLAAMNSAVLVVDLRSKSLYLDGSDTPVVLSNKPFCFYVALLKYCTPAVSEPLVHHDEIPEKLLLYADEIFQQLMKLGHTKRRQPNFASNLDKTLSEIRAALDEVFENSPLEKIPFYPPKAQGEGSRTKRHSYALENLHTDGLKFIFD